MTAPILLADTVLKKATPALEEPLQRLAKQLPKLDAIGQPIQDGFRKLTQGLDHDIVGHDIQSMTVRLKPGEQLFAEPGAMVYADSTLHMDTVAVSNPNAPTDFWSSLTTGLKRLAAGNNFFLTQFKAMHGPGVVHVSPISRGKIIPIYLAETGNLICHRNTFLCSDHNVHMDVMLAPRLGAGLLGGQGLVLQKLTGHGNAFLHAGGNVIVKDLKQGESLLVDHAAVVARTESVDYDIRSARGVSNALFGGEGLFVAHLTGPGRVYLQTHPEIPVPQAVSHVPQEAGISVGLDGLNIGF